MRRVVHKNLLLRGFILLFIGCNFQHFAQKEISDVFRSDIFLISPRWIEILLHDTIKRAVPTVENVNVISIVFAFTIVMLYGSTPCLGLD